MISIILCVIFAFVSLGNAYNLHSIKATRSNQYNNQISQIYSSLNRPRKGDIQVNIALSDYSLYSMQTSTMAIGSGIKSGVGKVASGVKKVILWVPSKIGRAFRRSPPPEPKTDPEQASELIPDPIPTPSPVPTPSKPSGIEFKKKTTYIMDSVTIKQPNLSKPTTSVASVATVSPTPVSSPSKPSKSSSFSDFWKSVVVERKPASAATIEPKVDLEVSHTTFSLA